MTTTVFSDINWNSFGKQVGVLCLPHSPDDDAWGVIPFPAASIKNGDGPVVVVTGAVHGDAIEAGQLAGLMHPLSRPEQEPEPVHFKSGGTLYAHGLVGHVRSGQNLAVLTQDVVNP